MDHPTFDTEEEFWSWWKETVSSGNSWMLARDILFKARLTIDNHLYEKGLLSVGEQAKIIEAARKLAYFSPPAS